MINGVSSVAGTTQYETYSATAKTATVNTQSANDIAVIYEPSGVFKKDDTSLIVKIKSDREKHAVEMDKLSAKMIERPGYKLAKADDMWSVLANGKFVANVGSISQRRCDISASGYLSSDHTGGKIVNFDMALSANDQDTMKNMRDAVAN